ncbi:hypothetical protein [Chitinophaga rhizophila]|uniref:Uncharacterized protein n=1 Tax=Chitinophaga rhizophila TaxID=2866212 RepID=A0ABS7G838_9BACT|nr:hypothetical protein [Chitinophaga rhizophila]MBW8683813.1 hypothetical protein [Chitinophaga rhizophila]
MSDNRQFGSIAVDRLHLDPENPRLPERLKRASDIDVLNWMLSDATLVDLMASIAENNFFNGEPVLAVNENGKYIVVDLLSCWRSRLMKMKLLTCIRTC